MKNRTLVFSDYDVERLESMMDGHRLGGSKRNNLDALADELSSGRVVAPGEIPPDVVTLNSRVILRDLDKDSELEVTLVMPAAANFSAGRLSVVSPVGTAILGYAVGDIIEWQVQSGDKRMCIEKVLYQPEACGHYHL